MACLSDAPDEGIWVALLQEHARSLVGQGRVQDGLERLQRARQVAGDAGLRRALAVTLGEIARVRAQQGQVNAALDLHRQALALFESLDDVPSQGVTLNELARIHWDRGEWGLARGALERAWACARDPGAVAFNGHLLGQLLVRDGEHTHAIQVLTQAAAAWRVLGRTERAETCERLCEQAQAVLTP